MIIETRKLNATDNRDDRIKVTAGDGATAEFPWPYIKGLGGIEAHAWAVRRLFPAKFFAAPVWVEGTEGGERFRVDGAEALAEMDEATMRNVMARKEDRQAALRRHGQRIQHAGTESA